MIEKLLKIASIGNPQAQFLIEAQKELETSPFKEDAKAEQLEILEYGENLMPKLAYSLHMSLGELDNFLTFELEKTASPKPLFERNSFGGHAARGGAAVVGSALGGVATSLLNDLYHSVKGSVTEKRNFEKMIKENPDLQELDPHRVKSVFKTLHNLGGSDLSGDPNVAASYVRWNSHTQGVDLTGTRDLIGSRSNLEKSKDTIKQLQGVPGLDLWHGIHEHDKNYLAQDKQSKDPTYEQSKDKHKFDQEERDIKRKSRTP